MRMDEGHGLSETKENWDGCFVELQIGVAPTQSHTFDLKPQSSHHHSEYAPRAAFDWPGRAHAESAHARYLGQRSFSSWPSSPNSASHYPLAEVVAATHGWRVKRALRSPLVGRRRIFIDHGTPSTSVT